MKVSFRKALSIINNIGITAIAVWAISKSFTVMTVLVALGVVSISGYLIMISDSLDKLKDLMQKK